MTLPMVMPANLRKKAADLSERFPGRLGLLLSPGAWTNPKGLPFALDNGKYPVWEKGLEWDREVFLKHLHRTARLDHDPRWVVVPDVVADAGATFASWKEWVPVVRRYGWPLAMAVQDGMAPKDVLAVRPLPEVIFVGGTTRWKWRSLRGWCQAFPRVHVGRVNTGGLLWKVHRCGAESSDGTGWYHHKQHQQLVRYLERSTRGLGETDDVPLFHY